MGAAGGRGPEPAADRQRRRGAPSPRAAHRPDRHRRSPRRAGADPRRPRAARPRRPPHRRVRRLASPRDLRAALDAGADDVMRIPFEPEVLAARVATGLRAARLRANEAMLRSLVDNIPGAGLPLRVRRRLDDGVAQRRDRADHRLPGVRTSSTTRSARSPSIEHPDDHEYVATRVMRVGRDRPPVLARVPARAPRRLRSAGCSSAAIAQQAGDGRWWLDGAIFDITARRAAERGAARARGHRGAARRGARLARPHPRGRRPRAPRRSSATSTTARSSASSSVALRPAASGSPSTRTCPTSCRAPTCSRSLDELRHRPRASCATSPAACTRPSSPTTGSSTRCARSAPAGRGAGRARARARGRAAAGWRSRPPPTSWSCEALTNVARLRAGRARPGSASRRATAHVERRRSATTASAAPRPARPPACRACATASPRSTGRSRSTARRAGDRAARPASGVTAPRAGCCRACACGPGLALGLAASASAAITFGRVSCGMMHVVDVAALGRRVRVREARAVVVDELRAALLGRRRARRCRAGG